MAFASNGRISKEFFEGSVTISDAQYKEALVGMMQGKVVSIDNGFSVDFPPLPPEPEPVEPSPPTVDDVAAERARRLALGFEYNFGDSRGVHLIATTAADLIGWDEVTKWSNAAIALGTPAATLDILTATGPTTVTALEWQSILLAATAARQPLWAASFVLQAMDPIPADYADNIYWP